MLFSYQKKERWDDVIDNETRRKIIIEYGAGATITALAEKYSVSRKTISKILTPQKSTQKVPISTQKVLNEDKKTQEAVEKVLTLDEQDNKELARKTVNAIMKSLPKDIQKASMADKMKVLERMVELFGLANDEEQEEVRLIITSEDASGGGDD